MLIKQLSNLTYREIDGLYYVTNPIRREVVVFNDLAFRILQLADKRTVEVVCDMASSISGNDVRNSQDMGINREDTLMFLESVRTLGLIEF